MSQRIPSLHTLMTHNKFKLWVLMH